MSSQPKIKWQRSQKDKLIKTVAKFNAKITREIKKGTLSPDYAPERLDIVKLRKKIESAAELNQLAREVNRAFKPNVFLPIKTPHNIKTTLFEINEIKLKIRRINIQRKKEAASHEVSTEKGTMGNLNDYTLKPKKLNLNTINEENWEKFKAGVDEEASIGWTEKMNNLWKENYLIAIAKELGVYGDELYSFVEKLDPAFLTKHFINNPVLTFDFIYDPLEAITIAETVLNTWKGLM